MRIFKLPAIAVSVVLSLMACSEDSSSIVNPMPLSPVETSSASELTSFGNEAQVNEVSSSSIEAPVNDVSSSSVVPPVNEVSSSSVAAPVVSSSSEATLKLSSSSVAQENKVSSSSVQPTSNSESDLENGKANGSEIVLKLAGSTATVENNNNCVEVKDKAATITCPGDYFVTGEASDFQVVVNTPGAENEGNTGIYLNNATLKSSNSPILVKNADKTVIHLVKGSVNVVEDGKGNHLFTTVNGKQDTAKAAS